MSGDEGGFENSPTMRALQELMKSHEELSPEEAAVRQPDYERAMSELMDRLKCELIARRFKGTVQQAGETSQATLSIPAVEVGVTDFSLR